MINKLSFRARGLATVAGVLLGIAVAGGCSGGATPPAEMPTELTGLDVLVSPQVALSGEGAGQHSNFGSALVGAVESRLVNEGFDIVQAQRAEHAVRIHLRAHVEISRNSFLMVNGKPLESTEARIQVKVLAPDGALLDSFDVEGDPDGETASEVAAQLAARMKGSRRLLAIAKGQPAAVPDTRTAAAETATKALARHKPARKRWPDVGKKVKGQNDGEQDFAVIVGIEKYAELTPVPGARTNAEAWFRYLVHTRGVPRGRVQMLVNEAARDKQIEKAVRDAVKDAAQLGKAGGKLWFVFIGHGAPSSEQQGLLVGYDAFQSAEGIADRSVNTNELLKEIASAQATPVVILDACFSGRSAQGTALVAGLQPSSVVEPEAPSGALVFTAAQSNQFAGPLPDADRPAFSYLTLGALRGWADRDGNGSVTAKEVEHYVNDTLRILLAGKRQQTPTLQGERDTFVLSKAAENEPSAIIGAAQSEDEE